MHRSLIILLIWSAAGAVCAEDVESTKDDTPTPTEVKKPAKDPTALSPRMKQALTEKRAEVVKEPDLPKLPEIKLKGLVKAGETGASAMIEIAGAGIQLARPDSEISVKLADGTSLTLKIKKINADSVEIEVPALKQALTLR